MTAKLFVGPPDKIDMEEAKLTQEIQAFRTFLHTYMHGRAFKSLSVNFVGRFGGGINVSVSYDVDTKLRKDMKKYK